MHANETQTQKIYRWFHLTPAGVAGNDNNVFYVQAVSSSSSHISSPPPPPPFLPPTPLFALSAE